MMSKFVQEQPDHINLIKNKKMGHYKAARLRIFEPESDPDQCILGVLTAMNVSSAYRLAHRSISELKNHSTKW